MKHKIIIGAVILLVAVAVMWGLAGKKTGSDMNDTRSGTGVPGEPADVVVDFYSDWLEALRSTSTDPYASGLAEGEILNGEMRNRLQEAARDTESGVDPVLCQTGVPEGVRTKQIFTMEDKAQMLVLPKGQSARQATVTLGMGQDGWLITDITCTQGDVAPEREFDFEQEGYLLKSVPPPLDPQYWHLVFEQDGVPGHTVSLSFDTESVCMFSGGTESVCTPDEFAEASKAFVQGTMYETGLSVKRLQITE